MEQKWSVRTYKEGDENGILELWKAVHPEREYDRARWLGWWRWMYKDNPAGGGRIWLAEHDGRIVGQYAIVPVEVKIGNEAILSSQSLDTMTHPDYRRQRMFETLARKVYDEAKKDGIYIVYGFPNEFSYPGFIKKLNWFDIRTMQLTIKPLNWRNAVNLKVKNRFLQRVLAIGGGLAFNKIFFRTRKLPAVEGLTINRVSSFSEQINSFWAKVSSQYQIMIVRDKDYLNWRYAAPGSRYLIFVAEKTSEIQGYLILEDKTQDGVKVTHIFDLVAQSEEVMHSLVSNAVEHCQQNKVDVILYSLIANKTYHRVVRRNGFVSIPFLKGGHFCAYSSSQFVSKEFLRNPENWLVQTGDSDTV